MNPIINSMNSLGASSILNLLRSGNPNDIAIKLMQNNPQFRSFYEQNKNKSVEQIAKENGLDLRMVYNILNQK